MAAFFTSALGIGREDCKESSILFSLMNINCRKLAMNFHGYSSRLLGFVTRGC